MNKKYLLSIILVLLLITIGLSFSYFVSKTTQNNLENVNTEAPTAKIPEFTLETKVDTPNSLPMYPGTKNYISATVQGKKEGGEEDDTTEYQIKYKITGSVTIPEETEFTEGRITYKLYKTTEEIKTPITCKEVSVTQETENEIEIRYSQECTINEKLTNEVTLTEDDHDGSITSGTATFTYEDVIPADNKTIHYYYLVVEYPNENKEQNQDMGKQVTYAINSIVSTETGEYKEVYNAETLIANHVCNEPSETITKEQAKNCLVNEKGYRFEGPNPNNYVRFNNEEWRIIGIFDVETENGPEQLIKIIRTKREEKSYDEADSADWEKPATLNIYLNGEYLNTINEKEKIANVKWNVGLSNYRKTVEEIYINETQTKTTNNYKVGLMNTSDYGFGALNISCKRSTTLFYFDSNGCYNGDWLFSSGWMLTPSSVTYIHTVWDAGDVRETPPYKERGFRPSVYLKSDVSLYVGSGSGDPGSKDNPYIVS